MPHFIYILYSEKLDKYYIGRSGDLAQRLAFHNEPIESRKFTARGIPWVMVFSFACADLEEAIALDKVIKKLKSRRFLARLIAEPSLIERFRKGAPDC